MQTRCGRSLPSTITEACGSLIAAWAEEIAMIELSKYNRKLLNDLQRFQPDTYAHSIRVKRYVLEFLLYLNECQRTFFSQREIDLICEGALLHDVGKMRTENSILTKETSLDPDEFEHVALHAVEGGNMVRDRLPEGDERDIVSTICARHHDKIADDSSLPLYVQIVSICDAYDALCSRRWYHGEKTPANALRMIRDGFCGEFQQQLVDDLENCQRKNGRL